MKEKTFKEISYFIYIVFFISMGVLGLVLSIEEALQGNNVFVLVILCLSSGFMISFGLSSIVDYVNKNIETTN